MDVWSINSPTNLLVGHEGQVDRAAEGAAAGGGGGAAAAGGGGGALLEFLNSEDILRADALMWWEWGWGWWWGGGERGPVGC